jgi:hypothetical protein
MTISSPGPIDLTVDVVTRTIVREEVKIKTPTEVGRAIIITSKSVYIFQLMIL